GTPTNTATPTRTSTPTSTPTVTPTTPPISLGCVFPNSAQCSANLTPAAGPPPMSGQIVAVAACTFGATPSPCVNFAITSTGFTATTATAGIPTGRVSSSVLVTIPVVGATGTSSGSVALNCPTNAGGNATCTATSFTGVWPQAGAGVVVN